VYLTSHHTGVLEFMEISEKVDIVQARVRAATKLEAKERTTGTGDLFAQEASSDPGEGRSSPSNVDAYWRDYLSAVERRIDKAAFADILESTDWFPGELQAALGAPRRFVWNATGSTRQFSRGGWSGQGCPQGTRRAWP